jgi:hypothetical protein
VCRKGNEHPQAFAHENQAMGESHSLIRIVRIVEPIGGSKTLDTTRAVMEQRVCRIKQPPLFVHHLVIARWSAVQVLTGAKKEVEMWSKEAFFCCLSFLVLPSLVRSLARYQDQQTLILRMRSSGAL